MLLIGFVPPTRQFLQAIDKNLLMVESLSIYEMAIKSRFTWILRKLVSGIE
jgi:hypothetical protein